METVVRQLTDLDIPSCRELWTDRFSDSGPFLDFFFERRFCPGLSFGCFMNGSLVSAGYGRPFRVRMGSDVRTGIYVAGVSTAKSHEKQGLMHRIMYALEDAARDADYPFLLLCPARESIYFSLGYKTVIRCAEAFGTGENVFPEQDRAEPEKLLDCFVRAGSRFSLYPERTADDMRDKLAEQYADGALLTAVRDPDGRLSGYALYGEDSCEEFTAVSAEAAEALLRRLPAGIPVRLPAVFRAEAPSVPQIMWKPLSDEIRLPENGPYFIPDEY